MINHIHRVYLVWTIRITKNNRIMKKIFNYFLSRVAPQYFLSRFWDSLAESDPYQAILTGVGDNQEFLKSGLCSVGYLENHFLLDRNWNVLDYGCGSGRVTRFIAPKVKQVIAADISTKMLNLLEREMKTNNIRTIHIRSKTLNELKDNSFDCVFSMLVLQHMNKSMAIDLFRALCRKLKIGGLLFMQFPSAEYKSTFKDLYATKSENDPSNPGLARLYSTNEIELLFHKNLISPLKIEFRDHDYYVSGQKVESQSEIKQLPHLFEELFLANITVIDSNKVYQVNQPFTLTCLIENSGNVTWRHEEHDLVNYIQLGIQLADYEGTVINRDFARAALPFPIKPGQKNTLQVTCPPVVKSGKYQLKLDMVNERHFWFHERKSRLTNVTFTLVDSL